MDVDVGHDPVSGISRSGRVRKKSAKLIEMEDFDSEFMTDNPRLRKKLQNSKNAATDSSSPVLDKSPVAIRKVSPIKITTKSLMPLPTIQHKRPHEGKSIPSISRTPQFVSLPASGFLDDEDDTFLQTEEVDSEPAEFQPALLSPLKIDIGGDDGNSIAVREESGLKMKFILSPKMKTSPQIEHMVLEKPTSKKSEKKASQRSKRKKVQPVVTSTPNIAIEKNTGLNVLTSATEAFSEDFSFFENEPGAHEIALTVDDVQDDGPKLVIAETPRAPPSKPKKKPAAKSKSNLLQIKIGKSSSSSNSKSKSKKNQPAAVTHELEPMFCTDQSDMSTSEMVSQAQSVYFKEKKCSAKKKSGKSKDKKAQDKDGKVRKTRPITAYMLWCREYRQKIVRETPNMDFATISRRLGEVWQTLPEKTKLNWRRQAKNLSGKTGKSTNNLINTGKQSEGSRSKLLNKQNSSKSLESPSASYSLISVPGTAPIDVAAYLKLLGESLGNIGQRLTEHEGQIAVSGSLSVLLDSTLSVLGPLLCLTSQVKELNGCDKEVLEDIMDNIAYIMPGP